MLRVVAVLAVVCGFAAPAGAQDINVQILSMDGRTTVDLADLATQMAAPISKGECDGDAAIEFRFTNVDPSRANLSLFYGSGCNDATVRNDTTDTSCVDLGLEFAVSGRSQVDATILASELIDCTATTSGTRTIWVLALDEPTSTVTGAGQSVSFPIAYDFAGPAAPSDFTAMGGENSIVMTWEGSADQVSEYEIYFVAGGCSGGSPTTELLGDPPSEGALYDTVEGTNRTYRLTYPSSTEVGAESAVAIRAVDRAGNASALSIVACVTRSESTSFWEAYCGGGDGGEACSGGSCAVTAPGGRRGGAGLPWAVAAGLALATALLVRRPRRRR